MYDTFQDYDEQRELVELQVKLYGRTLGEYWPGDQVPAVEGLEGAYSVQAPDGDLFANVTADNIFVGLTSTPMFDRHISKWGGLPDEVGPVVETLRQHGYLPPA